MKSLRRAGLVLAGGTIGLSLAASATGTTATSAIQIRHVPSRIEALAIDGNNIAYDAGSTLGKNNNRVLVWNVRTGKTTTVSGKRTRTMDDSSTGSGVFQVAVAGTRVAWLANVGGNSEGDDYLFSSSVTTPKEQQIAAFMRNGDNCPGRSPKCAGPWLGGLVSSPSLLAFNRWTTDDTGAVTDGELDLLNGTTPTQIATGPATVEAMATTKGRVAVLRSEGTVGLYSSSGDLVRTVIPSSAESVAWSVHNLVVLTKRRTLEQFYSPSGTGPSTYSVHGRQKPGNLDVEGSIAIYTTGSSLHAVDLGSRKDRVIGTLAGGIGSARISNAGVVYCSSRFASKGTLVFVPFARVAAAVH
jgi:hypothetical protein